MKARDLFTTIRTEGGLLPADLLQRLVQRNKDLPRLDDTSYHLIAGERLNERISQSWKRLIGVWNAFYTAANAIPEHTEFVYIYHLAHSIMDTVSYQIRR